MKKLNYLTILLCVIALISFTSCKKDGVYNPKKKIKYIFFESSGNSGKELEQTWTWDKNKLSKIDYGAGLYFRFNYDGKRVSEIINSNGGTTTFSYDGSKYDKIVNKYISIYDEDWYTYTYTSTTIYQFEYDGNKAEKVTITNNWESKMEFDYKGGASKKINKKEIDPMQFILPEHTCKNIAKIQAKQRKNTKSDSGSDTYTISYTWKGNNIEKEVWEYLEDGAIFTETHTLTYDNKKNPFYGLFTENESNLMGFSKNNPTKITYIDSDNDYEAIDLNYKYDGNFPIECVMKEEGGNHFYTRYYEYE